MMHGAMILRSGSTRSRFLTAHPRALILHLSIAYRLARQIINMAQAYKCG